MTPSKAAGAMLRADRATLVRHVASEKASLYRAILAARFTGLAERAQGFMAGIARSIDLQCIDPAQLMGYKKQPIECLERIIGDQNAASDAYAVKYTAREERWNGWQRWLLGSAHALRSPRARCRTAALLGDCGAGFLLRYPRRLEPPFGVRRAGEAG